MSPFVLLAAVAEPYAVVVARVGGDGDDEVCGGGDAVGDGGDCGRGCGASSNVRDAF